MKLYYNVILIPVYYISLQKMIYYGLAKLIVMNGKKPKTV